MISGLATKACSCRELATAALQSGSRCDCWQNGGVTGKGEETTATLYDPNEEDELLLACSVVTVGGDEEQSVCVTVFKCFEVAILQQTAPLAKRAGIGCETSLLACK